MVDDAINVTPADVTLADVAVVGAGLAGLVCAQQLQRAGLRVVVVEKSRGLGGRLATRRLQGTCADHGVRYLAEQGPLTAQLIQTLLAQNLIQPWTEARYTAPAGLTAVAKWLAQGLEIWTAERVEALKVELSPSPQNSPQNLSQNSPPSSRQNRWQVGLTPGERPRLLARAVVLAIPAPQALALVESTNSQQASSSIATLIQSLGAIEFEPCITAIATYPEPGPNLDEPAILAASPDLAWISQEQTKGRAQLPVLVVQSTAAFARQHLEASDLKSVGQLLLQQVAKTLAPEEHISIEQPTDLQVHRWRYALVRQPLSDAAGCLSTHTPAPLVCCGDWCSGAQIENALASGLAASQRMIDLLEGRAVDSNRMMVGESAIQTGTDRLGETVAQFTMLLQQLRACL
jgi:renalase